MPTHFRDSTNIAKRRARPCLSIAMARMKAPMNVKIVGEPKGPSASSGGTTPRITIAETPMRPPTGIGTGYVIHRTMTRSRTAASRC